MVRKLPSRYEDLDTAFRARIRPVPDLLDLVKRAYSSMAVSGGIRFLPLYGLSGSGKTCAALELGTHLPDCRVSLLDRAAIDSAEALDNSLRQFVRRGGDVKMHVFVVDQYEEAVADRTAVPSQFVERLSLLDRGEYRSSPMLFIWLTTRKDFQSALSHATSRNRRILLSPDFELRGPDQAEWPALIEETFSFHNNGTPLSDLDILDDNLLEITRESETLGTALERVGLLLAHDNPDIQDLSIYHVVMLWPVTDGQRIAQIQRFTDPRSGYRLDWNTWYRQLGAEDQRQLPLHAFNRARLYFDVRLVPIAVADLHLLCRQLDSDDAELARTYLERFKKTHFFSIVSGAWNPDTYSPLRERESARADEARGWYAGVTQNPTGLGKRIARVLRECGVEAVHERDVTSPYATVRADVLAERVQSRQRQVIVELKAYSAENTMPSSIRDAIRSTLRKHAHFAGFLPRQ